MKSKQTLIVLRRSQVLTACCCTHLCKIIVFHSDTSPFSSAQVTRWFSINLCAVAICAGYWFSWLTNDAPSFGSNSWKMFFFTFSNCWLVAACSAWTDFVRGHCGVLIGDNATNLQISIYYSKLHGVMYALIFSLIRKACYNKQSIIVTLEDTLQCRL